ncbi:hypothetical protein IE81DRAFT_36349 [Ceraceosorus guamensis]|uniref:Uncharacterized protein n=1 Tax=Ceraceosorus guamensis TaxID=1522189 RepID=A0A316W359_9BASI|nr:hypothetical protein IE81DRAFT_36349 [Ceraceosorus guamensis]PWN44152.1 hypothetical protein IE81DRAFT_36349 [Ceraceosorus guamensis]
MTDFTLGLGSSLGEDEFYRSQASPDVLNTSSPLRTIPSDKQRLSMTWSQLLLRYPSNIYLDVHHLIHQATYDAVLWVLLELEGSADRASVIPDATDGERREEDFMELAARHWCLSTPTSRMQSRFKPELDHMLLHRSSERVAVPPSQLFATLEGCVAVDVRSLAQEFGNHFAALPQRLFEDFIRLKHPSEQPCKTSAPPRERGRSSAGRERSSSIIHVRRWGPSAPGDSDADEYCSRDSEPEQSSAGEFYDGSSSVRSINSSLRRYRRHNCLRRIYAHPSDLERSPHINASAQASPTWPRTSHASIGGGRMVPTTATAGPASQTPSWYRWDNVGDTLVTVDPSLTSVSTMSQSLGPAVQRTDSPRPSQITSRPERLQHMPRMLSERPNCFSSNEGSSSTSTVTVGLPLTPDQNALPWPSLLGDDELALNAAENYRKHRTSPWPPLATQASASCRSSAGLPRSSRQQLGDRPMSAHSESNHSDDASGAASDAYSAVSEPAVHSSSMDGAVVADRPTSSAFCTSAVQSTPARFSFLPPRPSRSLRPPPPTLGQASGSTETRSRAKHQYSWSSASSQDRCDESFSLYGTARQGAAPKGPALRRAPRTQGSLELILVPMSQASLPTSTATSFGAHYGAVFGAVWGGSGNLFDGQHTPTDGCRAAARNEFGSPNLDVYLAPDYGLPSPSTQQSPALMSSEPQSPELGYQQTWHQKSHQSERDETSAIGLGLHLNEALNVDSYSQRSSQLRRHTVSETRPSKCVAGGITGSRDISESDCTRHVPLQAFVTSLDALAPFGHEAEVTQDWSGRVPPERVDRRLLGTMRSPQEHHREASSHVRERARHEADGTLSFQSSGNGISEAAAPQNASSQCNGTFLSQLGGKTVLDYWPADVIGSPTSDAQSRCESVPQSSTPPRPVLILSQRNSSASSFFTAQTRSSGEDPRSPSRVHTARSHMRIKSANIFGVVRSAEGATAETLRRKMNSVPAEDEQQSSTLMPALAPSDKRPSLVRPKQYGRPASGSGQNMMLSVLDHAKRMTNSATTSASRTTQASTGFFQNLHKRLGSNAERAQTAATALNSSESSADPWRSLATTATTPNLSDYGWDSAQATPCREPASVLEPALPSPTPAQVAIASLLAKARTSSTSPHV